jgi:hypothetical protein
VSSPVDLPLFPGSRPRRLAVISHQPPTLLTAVSRLSHKRSCSSLCSLGTDSIENSPSNSYSIVASLRYRTDRIENTAFHLLRCCVLQVCCLATGVLAEPFPSNGCLCWLHSSCLEQICHNIYSKNGEQSTKSSKLMKANGFQYLELENSGSLALNFEI